LEDKTGDWCTTFAQDLKNSSVAYLPQTTGFKVTRTCIVPSGTSLFIEVISGALSEGERPDTPIPDLENLVKLDQDNVIAKSLRINGEEVKDLDKYRFHTGPFNFTAPNGAMFGIAPGQYTAVAGGYFVMTEPLMPGNYTIRATGVIFCDEKLQQCLSTNYTTDATYNLIVK
jgi:hypothetical protein